MINDDLMRSFKQYKRQEEIDYINISVFRKTIFYFLFFALIPFTLFELCYLFFKKNKNKKTCFVFQFGNNEPMKTIFQILSTVNKIKIIQRPRSIPIPSFLLVKDIAYTFIKNPLWVVRNLDFLGALSAKISIFNGHKLRYNISNLILFQEYSFYSSYLTRIFEYNNGSLYNLMHGVPGQEAAYFRFTKCFVWGEYFKDYYIQNNAEKKQFIVAGSLYHNTLVNKCFKKDITYDIVYAMQGNNHLDNMYIEKTFNILLKIHKEFNVKIGIKEHPVYVNINVKIPKEFFIVNLTPIETICKSNLIISHFSTIFLDTKVLKKNVLAYIPETKIDLVQYLEKDEICYDEEICYSNICNILNKKAKINVLPISVLNNQINSLEIIVNEIRLNENI
jgi:hypothetical protein